MATTTTKTNQKKVNPNLKENLCCILFFLLLPIFALVTHYSIIGCVLLGVCAAALIVSFAVLDPADEQLAIGHFGVYFASSMLTVLGINFIPFADSNYTFNIDASTAYPEQAGVGLILFVAATVLKLFAFKKYIKTERNQLIRLVLDHLQTGGIFFCFIANFQESYLYDEKVLPMIMGVFTLLFVLFDCYDYYRTGLKRHHTTNIIFSIILYVVMLAGMLISREFNTIELLHTHFFALLKEQFTQELLIFVVPMLMALVSYIVCFKGPFASSEVRTFAVYLLFMLPMYLIQLLEELNYGWMLTFVHTGILAFALFYKGTAGGRLEKTFAAHKEYRVAISGFVLLICMLLMVERAYLAMVALLAFSIIMVFVLTRSKPIAGRVIWQVAMAGFTVLSIAAMLSLTTPIQDILMAILLWFITAAAMYLFTRGKAQKADKYLMTAIGLGSFILQLVFCLIVI